ncbi:MULTISPECIES: sulfotransferase [unclassified Nocardia]|uniref:sulfotransferase family protein n=1 Tax=unclassified Nocardia TaxID=2637762 RepID=UPI001CE4B4C2|nr:MULTISPECIES: sulfotransferase [unclassified Nocardia]
MGVQLDSDPILLGGENRSGTTLFSVVLDSHPDLTVGPELDFVEPMNLGSHIIEACDLLVAADPRVLGPGTDTADPFWYHGAHFVKQCERFGVGPEVLRTLVKEVSVACGSDLETLADRCRLIEAIGEYRRAGDRTARWGIKLQRKISRVDEFGSIWPRAHFVHIVRDGRDVAASHLKTVTWGYRELTAAARGWLEVVERPHTVAPADRYLEIRYEDLVADPKRTLTRVFDFVGLPWRDEVLNHSALNHTLFDKAWGHPAAEAAAKPLYRQRVSRYRNDLTASEIREFEAIAGHQLTRLGYGIGGEA